MPILESGAILLHLADRVGRSCHLILVAGAATALYPVYLPTFPIVL
jgi:hypothetical protein